MRVNVYAEEMTDRIELITKTVEEPTDDITRDFVGPKTHTFYGLKFWLKFPNQPWWIHRKASSSDGVDDDDSSAIILWAPSKDKLESMLLQALGTVQVDGDREGDDL